MGDWCFQTVVLERTLENPIDSKEIKPVDPNENQPWLFSGRTDAETEAPIFCLPDSKSQLIGKDPDAGKDWRQEKGMTEDEMVGWHHWLNGHKFKQTLGDSEGQGNTACCSSWSHIAGCGWVTEQQQQNIPFILKMRVCEFLVRCSKHPFSVSSSTPVWPSLFQTVLPLIIRFKFQVSSFLSDNRTFASAFHYLCCFG